MKWSFKLITLRGITLYLHATLLVYIGWLLVLSVTAGLHTAQVLWSMAFLAAVFASILLHEYGHALMAAVFGIRAKNITLYPIGGMAGIEKLPKNPRQDLLISAAGPAMSSLLAVVCWFFSAQQNFISFYKTFTGTINGSNFLLLLGLVNLALAVLNLLPAFPMDGGRILRALLAFRFNYFKASSMVATIGKVVGVLLVVCGLALMFFTLSLFGFFILIFAQAEEAYLQLKSLLKGVKLKDMVMYDFDGLDAFLTAQEVASVLQQKHGRYFLVMDKGLPVGTLNRMDVMKAIANQQYDLTLDMLMKKNLASLNCDTPVEMLLEKLSENEERLYPVFEKEKFIGVINFQQVLEYLLLHKTDQKELTKVKSLVELV